jgi:hypothetical protein
MHLSAIIADDSLPGDRRSAIVYGVGDRRSAIVLKVILTVMKQAQMTF